jgi:hypothetical protein
MDITKILADLVQEFEQIDEAILSLERFARGHGDRRGTPPTWMTKITTMRRGRPPEPRRSLLSRTPARTFRKDSRARRRALIAEPPLTGHNCAKQKQCQDAEMVRRVVA